jgi:hypothetical protein
MSHLEATEIVKHQAAIYIADCCHCHAPVLTTNVYSDGPTVTAEEVSSECPTCGGVTCRKCDNCVCDEAEEAGEKIVTRNKCMFIGAIVRKGQHSWN